jgi:peptidoglycan/LPS O-acetylase OafA/YrhL
LLIAIVASLCSFLAFGERVRAVLEFTLSHSLLAALTSVLIVIVLYGRAPWLGAVARLGVLRFLGRISYGLFLFHQLCNVLVQEALFGSVVPITELDGFLASCLALLAAVSIAWLCWTFVERPSIALSHRLAHASDS